LHIDARNVNDAFTDLVKLFQTREYSTSYWTFEPPISASPSRNGNVLTLEEPLTVTYSNPTERVLFNEARDANPFFHLYESLWMLSGRNDVEPLAYYCSKVREYSDNGVNFNGAYGYRWRKAALAYGLISGGGFLKHHEELMKTQARLLLGEKEEYKKFEAHGSTDQIKILIDHLKRNPTSRRAVLTMWSVEDDLLKIDESRDCCCNLNVMFRLRNVDDGTMSFREDRRNPLVPIPGTTKIGKSYLDMTVTNRSNDMIYGLLGANYVHFSILQEYMAAHLGVGVGKYHHVSNNLHVYDWNWKPELWLNSPDVIVETVDGKLPLVKDPVQFDKELPEIVESFSGGDSKDLKDTTYWKEPFFKDVAYPMFIAFRSHKRRRYLDALQWCIFIKSDDWRLVCETWIRKRRDNYERSCYHGGQEEGVV
jgi:thymidylate synthase